MFQYIIKRLLLMVPILLLVSIFTFGLVHFVPGDPARVILGQEASPDAVAALHHKLGLDQPLWKQYTQWVGRAATGNLGNSLVDNSPVNKLVIQRLPVTGELALASFLLAALIAVPVGIVSAVKRGTLVDYSGTVFALSGLSVPHFWLGIMMILFFSLRLGWLPASGFVPVSVSWKANLLAIILPALATGLRSSATIARFLRSSLLEVLQADYVRTARAKGLAEKVVILIHALRNALIPVITTSGTQIAGLLGGLVITETIFAIPGFGSLLVNAIFQRDLTVVQGAVLVSAVIVMVVNLLVDILYSVVDPRIKVAGGGK